MLKILGNRKTLCDRINRRDLLQVGGASALGLGLSNLLSPQQASASNFNRSPDLAGTFGKAKHCIMLFLYGAPSQLDTFDPKPDAPEDIRGPFGTIETAVPGVRLSDQLPGLSQALNKTTLIRSVTHPHPIHGVAYALTGIDKVDIPMELNRLDSRHWPSLGSVLQRLDEVDRPDVPLPAVPNYIHLPWELSSRSFPHKRAGILGGFLGPRYDPVVVEYSGQSTSKTSYRPDDPFCGIEPDCRFSITPPDQQRATITIDRMNRRRSLLEQFDAGRYHLSDSGAGESLNRYQDMAFRVLTSPEVHAALDLTKEPDSLRERYGYHLFGQSALLARRLIEAGTRIVSVFWDEFGRSCGGWDTHEKAEARLRDELCPGLDQTFTALLEDLEERGLLDETLIICMGEHGRTPQPERRGGLADGRGHWSRAYSALFAGAGVARGNVVGASDEQAAWVRERPVSPKDILRTIYHLMGVDADRIVYDGLNRPHPVVAGGEVIGEMLA